MLGVKMPTTWTANRCLALLKSLEVSEYELQDLVKRAQAVAQSRGSDRLGFRHFVTAQGIPWGRPEVAGDEGAQDA